MHDERVALPIQRLISKDTTNATDQSLPRDGHAKKSIRGHELQPCTATVASIEERMYGDVHRRHSSSWFLLRAKCQARESLDFFDTGMTSIVLSSDMHNVRMWFSLPSSSHQIVQTVSLMHVVRRRGFVCASRPPGSHVLHGTSLLVTCWRHVMHALEVISFHHSASW